MLEGGMMKYKKLLGGVGAAAVAFGLFAGCVVNVNAANTTLNVEVEEVLTATFSSSLSTITFDETGGFKTAEMTVMIDSNSSTGAIATLSTNALDANGSALKHTTSSINFIPSITTTVSKANFPVNHWGYSLDGQTFHPVPSAAESGAVFFTSTSNGDNASKTKTIYFGVNVDDTQFEGSYETEILITVVKNLGA